MVRIAILASGSGSNAEEIIRYLKDKKDLRVEVVVTNRRDAGVIGRADRLGIPAEVIANAEWADEERVLSFFRSRKIDFIVLAGFLRMIPEFLIGAYPRQIVNIHPALLPAYGGKGMYGMNVHRSVCANQEKESGITIHLVDEEYDRGEIVFQARCPVDPEDEPEDVQKKVQMLEHQFYPMVVEYLAEGAGSLSRHSRHSDERNLESYQ